MHRIGISFLLFVLFVFLVAPTTAQTEIWPTDGWLTATPESQGMDSATLAQLPERIAKEDLNIHSVLIIRGGYLVMEAYTYPYTADMLHHINSSTKSITSALVGIAIDQGFIEGVNLTLPDLFPDREIANLDAAKQSITLENLLTMSSGLDWSEEFLEQPNLDEMLQSADWVQYVLDRPMLYEPGQHYTYNTGGSHLLAAAVAQSTGQDIADFAQANLFDPLGIHSANWPLVDPQGVESGGMGLMLTPRDMAKFGYLYLHNGQWEGQQIISADWIAASTQKHMNVRPLTDGYGYQWWIDQRGFYMTAGYGGQHIIVHPGKDLVVVFTAGLNDVLLPQRLLQSIILPAIQSDEPLPENPEGQSRLAAAITAISTAVPTAVQPLPPIAVQISGQIYQLEPNDLGWGSITFTFTPESATAQLVIDENPITDIGLDNIFRVTTLSPVDGLFARGEWKAEDHFYMEYTFLGAANRFQLTAIFEDQTIQLSWRNRDTGQVISFTGTAPN